MQTPAWSCEPLKVCLVVLPRCPGDIEPKEDDIVIQQEGARLMVDELSMTFLEDCEIDYTEAEWLAGLIV